MMREKMISTLRLLHDSQVTSDAKFNVRVRRAIDILISATAPSGDYAEAMYEALELVQLATTLLKADRDQLVTELNRREMRK